MEIMDGIPRIAFWINYHNKIKKKFVKLNKNKKKISFCLVY